MRFEQASKEIKHLTQDSTRGIQQLLADTGRYVQQSLFDDLKEQMGKPSGRRLRKPTHVFRDQAIASAAKGMGTKRVAHVCGLSQRRVQEILRKRG